MNAFSESDRQLLVGIWESIEETNRHLDTLAYALDQLPNELYGMLQGEPEPVSEDTVIAEIYDRMLRKQECLNCGVAGTPENRSSNRCNQFGGRHSWPENW